MRPSFLPLAAPTDFAASRSELVGVEKYCTTTLTDALDGRFARSLEILEDWPKAKPAVMINAHRVRHQSPETVFRRLRRGSMNVFCIDLALRSRRCKFQYTN